MSFFKPLNKVSKFERLSANAQDEETKRKLEEAILIPDPLKPYVGPLPRHKCALDKRVVRIVFPSLQSMDVVNGILNITTSSKGITYITDISLFIEFCRRMKEDTEFKEQFKGFNQVSSHVDIEAIEEVGDSITLEDEVEDES